MFLVCDLETTSAKPGSAQILTGHFIVLDESLREVDEYGIQVRPYSWDRDADEASKIHKISRETAMSFPHTWDRVGPKLFSWLKKYRGHFVCHSNRTIFRKQDNGRSLASFDYAVLKTHLLDLNLYHEFVRLFPESKILSTHSIANFVADQFPFDGNLDLKNIATVLRLGSFDHHDAKADAVICSLVLKQLLPLINLERFLNWENFKISEVHNDSSRTRNIDLANAGPLFGSFDGLLP